MNFSLNKWGKWFKLWEALTETLESNSIGSELSISIDWFSDFDMSFNLLSLAFCLVTGEIIRPTNRS